MIQIHTLLSKEIVQFYNITANLKMSLFLAKLEVEGGLPLY